MAPNSPLSHYAQEQALEKLFDRGAISFEEYVEALDENATAPKSKLEQIVKRRKIAETGAEGGVFVHRAQWRDMIWTGLPAKSKNGEPAFLFWDSKGEE